jgi:sacsin
MNTRSSSLFNVLPLPIHINQPIHIHSRFSLSPDRARIHQNSDSSIQDPLPGQWNEWLFDTLVPAAWANLLKYLAEIHSDQSAFGRWPRSQDTKNLLQHIDTKVVQILAHNNYPIWYTELGYVTLENGLLATGKESPVLRKALNDAGVPVIYLPDELRWLVESTCKPENLSPPTLCERLEQRSKLMRALSEATKQTLLDFIISNPEFDGYGTVELFPFEDGTYKAIKDITAYVHRDDAEQLLFLLEPHNNIDLKRVSASTVQLLRTGCNKSSLNRSLRHRSTKDLRAYCLKTYFKQHDPTQDAVLVDKDTMDFIRKVWDWIVATGYSVLDAAISCLWLVPLTNGQYRKIKPTKSTARTIYARTGELGHFLKSLANFNSHRNKPIIQTSGLPHQLLDLLSEAIEKEPSLMIMDGNILEDFMLWLSAISEVFDQVSDEEKWRLHELLASRLALCKDPKIISNALSVLKVFERVSWKAENGQM